MSDDLICRQAAILALVHEQSWNMHEDQRTAIGVIADLPPADAQRWTPCSERLPEKEGLYLITCVDDDGTPFVDASLYDPPTDRRGAIWDFPNVVAWMERPEPYRGEEE